jgi:enoyl-CoA hydratase
MSDAEIICERWGASGHVLLNRPKALNALTLAMVRELTAALDRWADDPGIERVVVRGAGDRAFSAGGDIRLIHDQGRAGDHASQLAFWREEYQLNRMIARYPKPYVAMMDGFVMGGGAGVAIHGSHRIAGDRLGFAMPEVSIGFFPDVGATYFLPRLPGGIGAWLGLTGARIGAGDACASGLASAYVPSASFDALEEALTASGDTSEIIARFAAPPPAAKFDARRALIDDAFGAPDVATLLARLDKAAGEGDAFAAETTSGLRKKSPTSVAIGLRQMRIGAMLSIEDALTVEFRIVSRICRMHDFYEGVRATIIDKDQTPRWSPSNFADLDPAIIDGCFAPLDGDELTFPARSAW